MSGTRAKAIALVAALQLSAAATGFAQDSEVTRLFPAQPAGYVTDVPGVIDAASEARMEGLIERLRAASGAEIAVVTLPTIGDRSEAEVALAIGRAWGVGAKAEAGDPRRNAGIVVLLVPRQEGRPGSGHLRIEVGQGLEGIVTDA
ncbi:MAG: TPM domain-containing protein, partial [Acidobacteria bacterium]